MDKEPCYCPHHADGDENCEGCLGCKASAAAVAGHKTRVVARLKEWRKQYDMPGQDGEFGATAQSCIDSAIGIVERP